MSWRLVQGAQELTIPRAQKTVLVVLAHIADDDGRRCWAGMDLIGARAGIHSRNARKHIRALEAAGWVRLIAGGGRRTNEYQLDAARLLAAKDAAAAARRAKRMRMTGAPAGEGVPQLLAPTLDDSAPPARAVAPPQPRRTRPLSPGGSVPRAVIEPSSELEVEEGTVVSIWSARSSAPWSTIVHGVTCWVAGDRDDRPTVYTLAATHGVAEVEAVAARLREQGVDPRPSVVSRALLALAAERTAAAHRREAVTSSPAAIEDAATAAALAEAQMAAYRRAGGAA